MIDQKPPKPSADQGFVKTLNQMGFMTETLDPVSQAFVDFAGSSLFPAMDVGTAYGIASLAALEKGATVIANDLDERHLKILWDQAPESSRQRLKLLPGRFPEELNLQQASIGSALICRVLHFFTGDQITASFRKLHKWLIPGGKVFIVAETPYLQTLKSFIPFYEKRVQDGEDWPGYFDKVHEVTPGGKDSLPPFMHLLDPTVLSRVLKDAGFEIEFAQTLARKDFPDWLQLDGRESVGVIARKL